MPSPHLTLEAIWNGSPVYLTQGNIALLETDAIVSAANTGLGIGGGVSGAIGSLAGPKFKEECWDVLRSHGAIAPGNAVVTSGGNLKAKHVIHAVSPRYADDPVRAHGLLAMAYTEALYWALNVGARSIAFPCLGTGTYGFPAKEACEIAISILRRCVRSMRETVVIVFCVFSQSDYDLYESELCSSN
jgi:O-acetyl-ADP-ribose deacetylase